MGGGDEDEQIPESDDEQFRVFRGPPITTSSLPQTPKAKPLVATKVKSKSKSKGKTKSKAKAKSKTKTAAD